MWLLKELFIMSFDINLLAKNFLWSIVALFSIPANILFKNLVVVVDSDSPGLFLSCVS